MYATKGYIMPAKHLLFFQQSFCVFPAPLYLRTLWCYTNAVIIIIIIIII